MTSIPLKRVATNVREPGHSGPYVGLEHVQSGSGELLSLSSDAEPAAAITFRSGDVLFGKLRPYLRKVLLAPIDGRCSAEFLVLRPRPGIDARYLAYVMRSEPVIAWAVTNAEGAKMPRTEWEAVGQAHVYVPSPAEQRAIANYLDRETTRIDALIEKKVALSAILREKLACEIAAVTHADCVARQDRAGAPMDWHWLPLRRCFAIARYGIGEPAGESGAVAVLGMGNVGEGRVIGAPMGYVPSVDPILELKPGDLLFNRTNSQALVGKVGRVEVVNEPTTIASYLVLIRTNALADSAYLNHLLNTEPVLGLVRSTALPSIGQANLNPSRYGAIRVIVPPLETQRAIVQDLDRKCRDVESAREKLDAQATLLSEKRQALIAVAVKGQMDIPGAA